MSASAQSGIRAWSERAVPKHTLYKRLLLGTALAALVTTPALANPTGGQVSTGAATITSSGNNTSVKQTSEGVVINWSSFNIGNGQTTQFYQPNSKALAVNRIGSKNASQILGTLDANGSVVLINGNGILFGKGSKVDVGSLVATSTDGSDSDVLSGKFTKAGSQSATIVNRGAITTTAHGTVALVAPNVTNSGTVNAKLGTVSLGAANKFTIDLNGDGLVSFAAQGDVNGKASVTNRGRLVGANVSMTAHAAEGIATGVVNTSGVIVASGAHEVGGTIVLDAGDGGSIDVTGGKLEAKGPKGGGSIAVGSWSDASVTVNPGAILNASATKTGDGGHIKVVSNSTSFTGNALAQGGILSGNGGLIETSGHSLNFLGSTISASATHGKSGTWLLDPDDLTIDDSAANQIGGTLSGGTDVDLQTTSSGCSGGFGTCAAGSGDIIINSGITWDTTNTLTLDAWHSIYINYAIMISGAGTLDLQYNDAATDGTLNFGPTGQASFIDVVSNVTQGNLNINHQGYQLENSLAALSADITSNPTGFFALAENYDAFGDGTYTAAIIPSTAGFAGTFEGLGNLIENLTISTNTDPSDNGVGIFGVSGGTIRDLNIYLGSVTGSVDVGALVGTLEPGGVVMNVTSSMSVTGFNQVGGLIGDSKGTVVNASSYGTVTGQLVNSGSAGEPEDVGGLIGEMDSGSVSGSYATGNVTALGGYQVGGLIGYVASNNSATVSNSYAMGNVDAGVDTSSGIAGEDDGGLIGDNGGQVTNSYATGSVIGTQNVGGLIGFNENDAGGTNPEAPTGDGTVVDSYATGSVTGYYDGINNYGVDVGGLIGYNYGGVQNAYSMGNVTGGDQLGGLVGGNQGSLHEVYSTGMVTAAAGASPTNIGALVGVAGLSDITNAYWDTDTSGITDLTQGAGDQSSAPGITGMTTAALQGTLPTGFNNGAWGTGTNMFPYLTSQYSTGTPVALSGIAYTDAGSTIDVGDTVTGLADGNSIGSASTGANGYFYFLAAPGTQAAYVATTNGATIADSLTASNTEVDIWGGYFRDLTGESSLSAAGNDVDTAIGSNTAAENLLSTLPNEYIQSSASDFSLDETLPGTGNITVKTTAGDITVELAQEQDSGTLTLDSYGSIFVPSALAMDSNTNLVLTTGDGGSGHLDFQGGVAEFEDATPTLTINGTPYTLVFDLPTLFSDIQSNPSGDYALAETYYNASALGTLSGAPISTFSGKLEGLGSQIDNLTIDSSGFGAALFGTIAQGASVENLLLTNASLTGTSIGSTLATLAEANRGSIYNVYADGSVTASGGGATILAGLVGINDATGSIAGSGFNGSITDNSTGEQPDYAGGLVGQNGGDISQSYALGSMTVNGFGGGFVALNAGTIDNSYTTVAITGSAQNPQNEFGGFAESNSDQITQSYVAGTLAGTGGSAGFVYSNSSPGSITDSAWDEDTTGDRGTGVHTNTGSIPSLVGVTSTSGTTAFDESTYAALGFTFGAGGDWYMIDGNTRPFLQAEYSSFILNAHQLQLMAIDPTQFYALGEDITYDGTMWSSAGFVPVGSEATPFTGGIEGSSYTITDLTIDRPTQDYVGLIGYTCGCNPLADIVLIGGNIVGHNYVGAIAGYTDGEIINVLTSTNVTGNEFVGGIVGYADIGADIGGVQSSGAVSGLKAVGGVAGYSDGEIDESQALGSVTGLAPAGSSTGGAIGGFVGFNDLDASLEEDVAEDNVTANGTSTGVTTAAGGFAGLNLGEIEDSAALGNVSGQKMVGGFVGYSDGYLQYDYSTGKAAGDQFVGGFAGFNDADAWIIESYSLGAASVTGSVNGKDGDVGGLIGADLGQVSDTFSTGMVTCTASDSCAGTLGGFSGYEDGAFQGASYYDIYTSGISAAHPFGKNVSGVSSVTGEGTAALQSALPGTWNTSDWGIVSGQSYPYLQWQTGGDTPQVVSGLVENGTTKVSGVDVNILVDGQSYDATDTMASGADGYYYILLAPGSISGSGSNLVVYSTDAGTKANTFETDATGPLTGVALHVGDLTIHSDESDTAQLTTDMSEAVGDATGSQLLYTTSGGFVSGTQAILFNSASTFDIDSAINLGPTGALDLVALGNVTEDTGTGAITASVLDGSSSGGADFNGANAIADIDGWTNAGSGGFALTNSQSLYVMKEIVSNGELDLTTTNSGKVNIDAELDAPNNIVDLVSAGSISESASTGSIVSDSLEGSSAGGVSLLGANSIGTIDGFNTNGNNLALSNGRTLETLDTISAAGANVSLTTTSGDIDIDGVIDAHDLTLNSNGAANENANGSINVHLLNATARTGIDLDSTLNDIAVIGTDTTTSGSNTINKN